MAAHQQSGGLFRKYGARLDAAVKQHAMADPKTQGFPKVPAPIRDGTAELTSIGFYQYENDTEAKKADGSSAAGEYFFRAVGTIRDPEFIVKDGRQVKCEGIQTSQMIPVMDVKNKAGKVTTLEENIERIEGHLKLLGASKEELAQGAAALEGIAEAMNMAGKDDNPPIYFKFETSEGKATPEYPEPRVWENWYGVRERQGWEPPSKGPTPGVTNDRSRPVAAPAPAKSPAAQQVAKQAPKPAAKPTPPPAPEPVAELPDDVRELAALCETGDDAAVQKLQDMALALGITEEEWGATQNYGEAADLIEARQSGDGTVAEEPASDEPEPVLPAKGEVWEYFPVDPKTKKPMKKAVEVTITAVDKKTETATIQRNDTKATIKGVAFSDLVMPS